MGEKWIYEINRIIEGKPPAGDGLMEERDQVDIHGGTRRVARDLVVANEKIEKAELRWASQKIAWYVLPIRCLVAWAVYEGSSRLARPKASYNHAS